MGLDRRAILLVLIQSYFLVHAQLLKLFRFQFVLWSILLISCGGLPARAQAGEPEFTVTTKNSDDQVNIRHENGVVLIDVHSPSGIGSASFELESGSLQ